MGVKLGLELSESRMLRMTLQCEGEEEAVSNSRLREGDCVVSTLMIGTVLLGRLCSEQLNDR